MRIPAVTGRVPRPSIQLRAVVGLTAIACVCGVGVSRAEGRFPLPPPAAVCDQHPGTTLRQSGSLVLYGTDAGTNPLGQARTRYWACVLPDGASTLMGERTSGGKYPPDATMRRVTIAGSYVTAIESSGTGAAARCVAADGHFCHRPRQTVMLVDARGRSSSSSSIPVRSVVGRLLVGAAGRTGAAVWTQPAGRGQITISWQVLSTHGSTSEAFGTTLAAGAIDPQSLSLHGLRLRYIEHGQLHAVNLGRHH